MFVWYLCCKLWIRVGREGRWVGTKVLGHTVEWLSLCVRWNRLRTWHKVGSPYLRNLIISLSTMVLKILILMFDEISMIELILRVTSFEWIGLDLIFKLETFASFMCYFFQAISGFKNRNPSLGMDGIGVIFKLATLDELDDVINLNQSICVWFIPQGFSRIIILDERHFDLEGHFLQPVFCPCYLRCGSNNLCLRIL